MQAYDQTSQKVYLSTLNDFANGAFSSSVAGDETFDDACMCVTNNILDRSKVKGIHKGVLFRSLALAMKQLMNEMTINDVKKQYLESNLPEVPTYVKERYRGNFTILSEMSHLLIKRCNIVKNFARLLNVAQPVDINNLNGFVNAGRNQSNALVAADAGSLTREKNIEILNSIVDKLYQGFNSINQCIKNTLSEIGDTDKYMELYSGFIQNYESEYGMTPFMPLSSSLYMLVNRVYDGANNFAGLNEERNYVGLPIYGMGDASFKYSYGLKLFFDSESYKMDDLPGVKDIVKSHNQSSSERHHFADKDVEKFVNIYGPLWKYLVDAKRYRGFFSVYDVSDQDWASPSAPKPFNKAAMTRFTHVNNDLLDSNLEPNSRTYQILDSRSLTELVRLTESGYQKEQKRSVVQHVEHDDSKIVKGSRTAMIAFNIIDLNLVPINVHALMREMPLVNLYNYEHTFDCLTCDTLGVNEKEVSEEVNRGVVQAPWVRGNSFGNKEPGKRLLAAMLLNPYVELDETVYEFYFSKIARGDLGLEGLGVPKFLGAELYGKVLFGELYAGRVYEEEGGPNVGEGHLHGKQQFMREPLLIDSNVSDKQVSLMASSIIVDALNAYINVDIGGWHGFVNSASVQGGLGGLYASIKGGMGKYKLPAAYAINYNALVNSLSTAYNNNTAAFNNEPQRVVGIAILLYILTSALYHEDILNELKSEMKKALKGGSGNLASIYELVSGLVRSYNINLGGGSFSAVVAAPNYTGAGFGSMNAAAINNLLNSIYTNVLGASAAWNINCTAQGVSFAGNNTANMAWTGGAIPSADTIVRAGNSLSKTVLSNLQGAINNNNQRYEEFPVGERNKLTLNNPSFSEDVPQALHYMEKDKETGKTVIRKVDVNRDSRRYKGLVQAIGKLRFSTVWIRNLVWLTNIQRILRFKLRRDLFWYDDKVVKDHAVLASGITELYGNDLHNNKTMPYTY
jgi:hypothetical protein